MARSQRLIAAFISWFIVGLTAAPHPAHGRPEFALRIGQNRCTACHYSPSGEGPKNTNGKYYGAGPFRLSPFSQQEYAGADVKALYYLPERHGNASGGAGIMAVNVYASLTLTPLSEETYETRLVAEQNLGGFGGSVPRNLYVRWQTSDDKVYSWKPQFVTLGRFVAPFGLMTDEHRTYVRIQTNTVWNLGFDTGVMASSNPFENLHYDLAFFNGQKNPGNLSPGQGMLWGLAANLRHMPRGAPVLVGASTTYYDPVVGGHPPSAWSVYGALSGHRLAERHWPVTLLLEYASARNWNPTITQSSFMSDPTGYGVLVADARSEGWLIQLNWDLSPNWVLTYKFDRLALNQDYPRDAYQRHGIGAKYVFGPLMWTMLRLEAADAGYPTETHGNKVGALDAAWAVFSIGI